MNKKWGFRIYLHKATSPRQNILSHISPKYSFLLLFWSTAIQNPDSN